MAMILYTGAQRAGKSYEVVKNVIVAGILQGRDVVTNIAGVNQDAIYTLLISEGHNPETFGKIKLFEPEWLELDRVIKYDENGNFVESFPFLFTEQRFKKGEKTFIQAGDACAFDEIWRFWPSDKKPSVESMNFFRMHGHAVHPVTGLTIEIALLTQSVDDLHSAIKRTIIETYYIEKNTVLGSDTTYTVKVFYKTNLSRKPKNEFGPYKYDIKYGSLYKSNSLNQTGIKPVENRIDKRNTVWNNKLVKFGFPIGILLFLLAINTAIDFFSGKKLNKNQDVAESENSRHSANSNSLNEHAKPKKKYDDQWRLAGVFGVQPNLKALLVDRTGHSRIAIINTLSEYGQIVSVTTYPENSTYSNQPFEASILEK